MSRIPHCLDSRFTDDGEDVSFTQQARSTPHKPLYFLPCYSFLLEAEQTPNFLMRPEGLSELKIFNVSLVSNPGPTGCSIVPQPLHCWVLPRAHKQWKKPQPSSKQRGSQISKILRRIKAAEIFRNVRRLSQTNSQISCSSSPLLLRLFLKRNVN
jgi:hypothetical protein